jgi:hypothetical protein
MTSFRLPGGACGVLLDDREGERLGPGVLASGVGGRARLPAAQHDQSLSSDCLRITPSEDARVAVPFANDRPRRAT